MFSNGNGQWGKYVENQNKTGPPISSRIKGMAILN
jgi:hypothetical protein